MYNTLLCNVMHTKNYAKTLVKNNKIRIALKGDQPKVL